MKSKSYRDPYYNIFLTHYFLPLWSNILVSGLFSNILLCSFLDEKDQVSLIASYGPYCLRFILMELTGLSY